MSRLRFAPDRIRALGVEQLERDRAHRRHARELDEPLGVRVLDEAHVAPEEMDNAMTNGAGWPLGPCALVDLIGIDVHVHASEALHAKLGEERMAPPERLVRMVEAGDLGRKTGKGFFAY